jgi:hypothetical protein
MGKGRLGHGKEADANSARSQPVINRAAAMSLSCWPTAANFTIRAHTPIILTVGQLVHCDLKSNCEGRSRSRQSSIIERTRRASKHLYGRKLQEARMPMPPASAASLPTKTSSRSGRTQTPTYPSLRKPNQSTRNCSKKKRPPRSLWVAMRKNDGVVRLLSGIPQR